MPRKKCRDKFYAETRPNTTLSKRGKATRKKVMQENNTSHIHRPRKHITRTSTRRHREKLHIHTSARTQNNGRIVEYSRKTRHKRHHKTPFNISVLIIILTLIRHINVVPVFNLWEPSSAKQRLGKHVSTEMQFLDKQSVAR
jgi:hypothetical protein